MAAGTDPTPIVATSRGHVTESGDSGHVRGGVQPTPSHGEDRKSPLVLSPIARPPWPACDRFTRSRGPLASVRQVSDQVARPPPASMRLIPFEPSCEATQASVQLVRDRGWFWASPWTRSTRSTRPPPTLSLATKVAALLPGLRKRIPSWTQVWNLRNT